MMQGIQNAEALDISQRFRQQYLQNFRDALAQINSIVMDITPDGVWVNDALAWEASERKGDIIEGLYTEGVRRITVEFGADDQELDRLAEILMTRWSSRSAEGLDLLSQVWESDFTHVHFEVLERLDEEGTLGESPMLPHLQALMLDLSRQDEVGLLRQDEADILVKLRQEMESTEAGQVRIGESLPAHVTDEVNRLLSEEDLEGVDLGGLLAFSLRYLDTFEDVELIGRAMVDFIGRQWASGQSANLALLHLLDFLDPEVTPFFSQREALRRAAQGLFHDERTHHLGQHDDEEHRAVIFSLVTAAADEGALLTMVRALPTWATRVVADAVLAIEWTTDDGIIEQIRGRLLAEDTASIRLGLGMASRLNAQSLVDVLMEQTHHNDPEVREAALYALRQHDLPRVHERVRVLLQDSSPAVRMEALRHCVAYRDATIGPLLESRLTQAANLGEPELRAICIALGRLYRGHAEMVCGEYALGTRRASHPMLPKLALQGLRAANSHAAKSYLDQVSKTHPTLATEAREILQELN